MIERLFRVSERGSTVGRELRGGLVTFVTMSYIIVLNPLILGSFAPDGPGAKTDALGNVLGVPQVAAVTALVAGVMTLLFGLIANYPFAIATGLGINTLVVHFLLAMFFTPLYSVVPIEAAAPALVIVGALLMRQITQIDFTELRVALPAFLTIVVMPFTYSSPTPCWPSQPDGPVPCTP